ncbi:MAG: tRNA epoxyqueuosine(34) reductase QueG [Alphaproteobacteria bacterium]
MSDVVDIKKAIRDKALEVGFDAVGFAAADGATQNAANLNTYLSQGRHGDMGWMTERTAERAAPKALWPGARSVIVLGMNYGPAGDPMAILEQFDRGAISVYAQGRDYHDLVKKRLKQLARWLVEDRDCEVKVFVDTAPVMEKPLAMQAGLGWQGKHTNLVSGEFGSWLFLGEVFTSLEIPPDPPAVDQCGTCTKCLDACPTGALTAPYEIDARRCISYLSIEHKGDIEAELAGAMGNHIYGCDDCLSVCPWNKFASPTPHDAFFPRLELTAPRLSDLAKLDDAAFRELFSGSPVKRTGHQRFSRNVRIAIANGRDKSVK